MRKAALLLLSFLLAYPTRAEVEGLGVRTGQFTTVAFPDEILDLSLGSSSYAAHIKGRYLLIKAKSKQVSATSLFLRYGPDKQGYTAVVYFDRRAPLLVEVNKTPTVDTPEKESTVLFSTVQDYHSIGLHQKGLRMMGTHLMHQGDKTYVRLYIDNRRSIPCHLSSPSFEYLSRKRYLLFFSKYKGRVIELLEGPRDLSLSARSGGYFLFVLPA
ncbi:MAG: hypothetical protein AAF706_03590, partial [Bacteroidota bacterium]